MVSLSCASVVRRTATWTDVVLSVVHDFYFDSVFYHVHGWIDDLDSLSYIRVGYDYNADMLMNTNIH